MKNWKRWLLAILLTLVIAFVYYYINLPALNIHSAGFWCFVILMVFVFAIVLSFRSVWKSGHVSFGKKGLDIQKGTMGPYRYLFYLGGVLLLIFLIGSVLSSPIIIPHPYTLSGYALPDILSLFHPAYVQYILPGFYRCQWQPYRPGDTDPTYIHSCPDSASLL